MKPSPLPAVAVPFVEFPLQCGLRLNPCFADNTGFGTTAEFPEKSRKSQVEI